MLSSLQLRHTSFTEVSIQACENGSFQVEPLISHDLSGGRIEGEEHLWRVEMCLEIQSSPGAPFAYEGKICAQGIIEVHPDHPSESLEHTIQVHGAALLYGVIREMVVTITSRSTKGLLMLPTINFLAAYADEQKSAAPPIPKRTRK